MYLRRQNSIIQQAFLENLEHGRLPAPANSSDYFYGISFALPRKQSFKITWSFYNFLHFSPFNVDFVELNRTKA
jgi:hypothetical protein